MNQNRKLIKKDNRRSVFDLLKHSVDECTLTCCIKNIVLSRTDSTTRLFPLLDFRLKLLIEKYTLQLQIFTQHVTNELRFIEFRELFFMDSRVSQSIKNLGSRNF